MYVPIFSYKFLPPTFNRQQMAAWTTHLIFDFVSLNMGWGWNGVVVDELEKSNKRIKKVTWYWYLVLVGTKYQVK